MSGGFTSEDLMPDFTRVVGIEDFYRHGRFVSSLIPSQINRAHPALPNLILDQVAFGDNLLWVSSL